MSPRILKTWVTLGMEQGHFPQNKETVASFGVCDAAARNQSQLEVS